MDNNVKNEILEVINTIPADAKPLEKVRWVYIKLGKILSFDNKTFNSDKEISLDSDYIDRYETCVQTSILLNEILNNIDPNIKCEVVERKLQDRPHRQEHLANIITINNDGYEEKYLLDLTLDLYRIHYDLKTQQFGYCGHPDYVVDILPQVDNDKMDKKLGLYSNGYMDPRIKEIKDTLAFIDFSNMSFEEEMDYRIAQALPLINMNNTYSEKNEFIYIYVIDYVLGCSAVRSVIRNGNEQKYVYIFYRGNEIVWYICDEECNFYKTTREDIESMLNNGWINNKGILIDYLENHSNMSLA